MNALTFLRSLHSVCHLASREGGKLSPPSNREFRRWFDKGMVIIDGFPVTWDHEVQFPVHSLVLFPRHPVTLWNDGTKTVATGSVAGRLKKRWIKKLTDCAIVVVRRAP